MLNTVSKLAKLTSILSVSKSLIFNIIIKNFLLIEMVYNRENIIKYKGLESCFNRPALTRLARELAQPLMLR